MNILKFQISLENKRLNNLLISKTNLNIPLIYESAYYVLIYNNEELIGISKNYFFNNHEDVYIFKDNIFTDISQPLKEVKEIAINYTLWIKPEYRNLTIGKKLLNRTLIEFKHRAINKVYVVSPETNASFYSSVIQAETKIINSFQDNHIDYNVLKFNLHNLT